MSEQLNGPDPLELAVLEARVELARTVRNQAQVDLAEFLREGPDPLVLAVLEANLDQAMETLAESEKDLARLAGGPDPLDLAFLETKTAAAKAALEEAREELNGAFVRAPFNGVVSVLNLEADDQVNTKSRVIQLVDPTAVEVRGVVDAGELQFVRPGASAMVTLDSLPNRSLDGTVSLVAAEPRTERGVISYPITIRVDVPQGLRIPVRLSGVTSVVVLEEN